MVETCRQADVATLEIKALKRCKISCLMWVSNRRQMQYTKNDKASKPLLKLEQVYSERNDRVVTLLINYSFFKDNKQ